MDSGDAAEPGTATVTIVKPDGRYLVFYTFADAEPDPPGDVPDE